MSRKGGKIEWVDPSTLRTNEEFAPQPDPILKNLILEAVRGRVPVHVAAVPLKLIRRLDHTHRPDLTVSGKKIVAQIGKSLEEGAPWPMWVYPSDGKFVMSDDYLTLAAYEREGWDFAACLVLGTPEGEGVALIRGPLLAEEVKGALGFK